MANVNVHDTPAYWESLGRFVQAFATIERNFTAAILVLVDPDFRVSAPIVAPLSLQQRINLTRQVFPVRRNRRELAEDCERVLSQMEVIASVRNLLLHNGTLFSDTDGATTARMLEGVLKPGKKPKPLSTSVEVLQALAADCVRIAQYWFMHSWYPPQLAASECSNWRPQLQKPWSYTKS
jgi:hypothetical protein